jgi:hypothetical protein
MKKFAVAATLFLATNAWAQPPAEGVGLIARHDFEDGRPVFQPFGDDAQVGITTDAANVKNGRAALKFDYKIAPNAYTAMILIGEPGAAAQVKSFSFWLKSDYASSMMVVMQEQDGGRYAALFHAPKNLWQRVELEPSDFSLLTGNDDPKDPNNKLDMERVVALAIGDFNQIFANVKDETIKQLIGLKLGAHTLYVDDFTASKDALPETPGVDPKNTSLLDAFTRPQAAWSALGDMVLKRVTAKEMEAQGREVSVKARGLQAEYRQQAGKLAGVTRMVRPGQLAGMAAFKFNVATEKPMTLAVQLEETSGGKYVTTVELPADTKPSEVRLVPALFAPTDDSKDDHKRLDPDQVKQIIFFDVTGLFGQPQGDNVLWLSDVRVEKPTP